ncbi:MAG: GAF domain-containing protein [Candidatus Krumholzibacteriales bacterium]
MSRKLKIAVLGGSERELSVIREIHGKDDISIIGVYDRDDSSPGIVIGEVIGLKTVSDDSYLELFRNADLVITNMGRRDLREEADSLSELDVDIIDISDVYKLLLDKDNDESPDAGHETDKLDEALRFMNRIADSGKLLKWILRISAESLGASQGSLMLYSESTEELYIGYATGLSEEVVKETRLKLGEGIAGKSASIRKAILTRDIGGVSRPGMERENITTAVTAPVIYRGKLLGVLNISTDRGERELDESDRDRITVIASKIAPLLNRHLRLDKDESDMIETSINEYLERASRSGNGFHYVFTMISKFINGLFNAATTSIYTATDEGDWLILGGSNNLVQEDESASRVHCISGTLARAYLSGETIVMTEDREEEEERSISIVYQPLFYNEPVGVIVIEFDNLCDQERYLKYMDRIGFRLGIFIASRLQSMKQQRRLENLEKFSRLVPRLIDAGSLSDNLKKLPGILADFINAASASLHYFENGREEVFYHNFPENETELNKYKRFDSEIAGNAAEKRKAECTSFLSASADNFRSQPYYRSVIVYPLLELNRRKLIFAGYNKKTVSPLDPSIFGKKDIELIEKAENIIRTLYSREPEPEKYSKENAPLKLDKLLEMNQTLLISRIDEEIRRAGRYHHTFTLTTIRIKGLKELLSEDREKGLQLINQIGSGIKNMIRSTDYYSWIETDTFTVLSIESLGRIKTLEERINKFINSFLEKKDMYDPESFKAFSSYARFPGKSKTPSELIIESRKLLPG